MIRRSSLLALTAALLFSAPAPRAFADTDPSALVDALESVFGTHAGFRRGHANGVCVKGSFTASAEAGKLTTAKHLSGGATSAVIGRFSMGGGNPNAPHTQKDNARGLALHFDLGNGETTDLVMISAPVFIAKTPEIFLELLQTVATKDKDKIGAFFKAHPESTQQGAWLNARPVPASYASVSYYGVHAFTLTNADGAKQVIKWKFVPKGGETGLSDDEVKAKAADFYGPELKERLAKGPAEFDLTAVLGESSDPLNDPTALWPEDSRKSIKMGTLSIAALEDNATCDAGIFDPTNVTSGIEGPKDDGIFEIRSPAYGVSATRRAK